MEPEQIEYLRLTLWVAQRRIFAQMFQICAYRDGLRRNMPATQIGYVRAQP